MKPKVQVVFWIWLHTPLVNVISTTDCRPGPPPQRRGPVTRPGKHKDIPWRITNLKHGDDSVHQHNSRLGRKTS